MSNLGGYQWLTTTAKKVGGPINLMLITASTGAAIYKSSEIVIKNSIKAVKKKYDDKKLKTEFNIKQYTVKTFGVSNEGLEFKVGEQFKVLESDGKAVLIEKIGDTNNPYFVSVELLKEISDYEK